MGPAPALDELLAALTRRIDETVLPLLRGAPRCALVDFPTYSNVGDSAIWLGERALLRRSGVEVAYVCDRSTYSRARLAARVGDGTILIQGGGNLGDLWPLTQAFREQVVSDFPGNPVVQLPQTIHFERADGLARAAAVLGAHRDLTVLARDPSSLGLRAELCPDLALALGPLARPAAPVADVLWLARSDRESAGAAAVAGPGVEVTDWLDEEASAAAALKTRLGGALRRRPSLRRGVGGLLARSYDPIARRRLARGCALLARGRVVVTDRLHGHVLSLLLGIPHVLLPDRHGKVVRFYETWTADCDLARFASSPEAALAEARRMLP